MMPEQSEHYNVISQGGVTPEGWKALCEYAQKIGARVLPLFARAEIADRESGQGGHNVTLQTERLPQGPVLNRQDFFTFAEKYVEPGINSDNLAGRAYHQLIRIASSQAAADRKVTDLPLIIMEDWKETNKVGGHQFDLTRRRNIEASSVLRLAAAIQERANAASSRNATDAIYSSTFRNLGYQTVAFWHALAVNTLLSNDNIPLE